MTSHQHYTKKHSSVRRTLFAVLSVILIAVTIYASVYAYSLINTPDYITIGVGESYTLATREGDYLVRSYNAHTVTVSTGSTVKATSVGDAIVGIKYTYFDRDFYRFVVVDAPKNITLNKTELILGEGESYTLKATSKTGSHEFSAAFSSSNEAIATVSEDGKITALNVGECIISATTYNGITASCELAVKKAPESLELNHSSVTLGTGETISLEPVFSKDAYSSNVVFESSDDNIASLKNNVLTAKNTGECTITATAHNQIQSQCKVTVKKMADNVYLTVLDKYDIDSCIRAVTTVDSDCAAYNITLSVSDESVLAFDEKDKAILHPLKQGECTITATLSNGVTTSKTVTIGDYDKSSMNFKILNQFPSLPTGCEVVSLTSVLNHYGEDISMNTMAEKYMPMKKYDYFSVSPHDYFLGTPYSFQTGMGCFSGCIVKTANNYFKDKNIEDYVAVDITGCSLDELLNFLNNKVPVITWVTSGFVTPTVDGRWTVNNETITWCNHEHCLVTTGYDKNAGTVTVADDTGGYSYTVSYSQYKKVFEGMGSMAVVILKK